MHGSQVQSPVWEDPPEPHNYWAWALKAHASQQEKPPQWEAYALQLESSLHSLQLEKAHVQQQRPSTARNWINKIFK